MCICNRKKIGKLVTIVGPMFAGKTSFLLNLLERLKRQKKKVKVFKPSFDSRYGESEIMNHKKEKHPAINVKNIQEIIEAVDKHNPNVVLIDEIQFFTQPLIDVPDNDNGDSILNLIKLLNKKGIDVYCSGLPTDFHDNPFIVTAKIMACSDKIEFLTSICDKCGDEANKTSKLSDNGETFELGNNDKYYAECKTDKYQ